MQGNFFKLTIGDYIKSTPGIINSVGVTIASESPWEVGERTTILPHVMDISIEFAVLEDKTPQAILDEVEDTSPDAYAEGRLRNSVQNSALFGIASNIPIGTI